MGFMFIYLQKQTVLNCFWIENTRFTDNIKPTLSLQDGFDIALENIIFEPKITSIERGDKNYELE